MNETLELYKLLAAHPYIDVGIKLEPWSLTPGLRITVTNYLGDVRRCHYTLLVGQISEVEDVPVIEILKHMIEEVEK